MIRRKRVDERLPFFGYSASVRPYFFGRYLCGSTG
jgi:hypothetical protein